METFYVKQSGGTLIPKADSITGLTRADGDFEIVEKTTRIPLRRSYGLGVVFWLNDEFKHLQSVTLRVTYPPMRAPQGKLPGRIEREQPSYKLGEMTLVDFSYFFDEEWELVHGKWTIEIWGGDRLLRRASFVTFWPGS